MSDRNPYSSLIREYLGELQFPVTPERLYDPIRYILSLSGKRVRPMLVLMGAKLFGEKKLEQVLPASSAIEFFHNFSLIHDDIMDKAPLRRGKSAVHVKWNDNVAILSGDALLVKAYQELAKSPVDKVPALLEVFNSVALQVCEGQQLDMDYQLADEVSEADYLNMIKLKTSVLLGGALKMGAILAGATGKQQDSIYDFGVNLGIAFQLQDDYLDVYGDPQTFGKQIGGDILCNKKTILHVRTRSNAKGKQETEFEFLLKNQQISDVEKINRMKLLYKELKVDEYAIYLKKHYMQLSYSQLMDVDVLDSNKVDLIQLADSLMNRIK